MAVWVTFVRHGDRSPNVEGAPRHPGPPLSKKGLRQAKQVANYLNGFSFDMIYSSDMTRALETAELIKKHHKCKHAIFRELSEFNSRVYTDEPDDLKKQKFDTQIANRSRAFFKKLLAKNNGKKILIVGHGNCIRSLIGMGLGFPLRETPYIEFENCSITTIVYRKGKIRGIMHINATDHLNIKKYVNRAKVDAVRLKQ